MHTGDSFKVSVIIPTKNPGDIFTRVLESVLRQKTPWPFEVLVIDSGSTDGTREYVASVKDPRLRLLDIPPATFGHGRTRNLGIAETSGEYAAMITHDAQPADAAWLRNLVAVADSDPDIAGVFGRHLAHPGADANTVRELETHFSAFQAHPVVWLAGTHQDQAHKHDPQFLHFFSNNNSLIRRSVWARIPFPDIDFAEDQQWAQRILEAGHKKAYAHDAVVFHSHNFGLVERLQRSFDESCALNRLFGYRLCASMSDLLRRWRAMNRHDASILLQSGLSIAIARQIFRRSLDNGMRLLGHYLGTHGSSLPSAIVARLSRDQRMQRGLVKGAAGVTHG